MIELSAFNEYLYNQLGMPYLFGGQHTELTPQNYVAVITRKETSAENIEKAIKYCEKKFAEGYDVLYAYDCSGLGMYYLQNVTHEFPSDLNANGMMGKCDVVDSVRSGYWVFRTNESGRATHIGYMVSDTELIEAKGRAYGVVLNKYKPSAWSKIGKPRCIEFDDVEPTPPEPIEPTYMIKVHGRVNVRNGNGVLTKKLCTVGIKGEDTYLPYLGQAQDKPYWYMTEVMGQVGFISSDPKYTEIVEVTL